jgi:hypothetical protein
VPGSVESKIGEGAAPMKLIVSHLEMLKTYITREFYYVMTDLMSTYGWKQIEIRRLWEGAGTVKDKLMDEFGELPETILFWQAYEFLNAQAADIRRLDSHKLFFADDLHWFNNEMRQEQSVSFALCDTILSTYAYTLLKFYPELFGVKKVAWIPHSASPDFMLRYNEQPENAIFLSGYVHNCYPLRLRVKALHDRGSYPIAVQNHPGYGEFDFETSTRVGPGCARQMNSYRAAFTDASEYGYSVAKYFEIPATGSLLLADRAISVPLRRIGFVDGVHYIGVSNEDLEEKLEYVLDKNNHHELDEIRRKGQELVWKKHKTSDRARLIDEICAVKRSRSRN